MPRAKQIAKNEIVKPLTITALGRRFHFSNTARQFGFRLAGAAPGSAVLKMRVRARHKQIHGVVHGGVLASIADTAGGLATYLSLPPGSRTATVEMKINFLEPVHRGTIFAEARVLRLGKYLAVVECDVVDDHGKLVAKALMTFSVGPEKSRPRN
ncbi:MAG TPA: PaaI family thioesterase [Candidatus Limnocylindrales bacterium]|nr:PaaI family thioesterase [Candidatus Limnocylindrales bacterium]